MGFHPPKFCRMLLNVALPVLMFSKLGKACRQLVISLVGHHSLHGLSSADRAANGFLPKGKAKRYV